MHSTRSASEHKHSEIELSKYSGKVETSEKYLEKNSEKYLEKYLTSESSSSPAMFSLELFFEVMQSQLKALLLGLCLLQFAQKSRSEQIHLKDNKKGHHTPTANRKVNE